jgi:hypothetical protein
MDPDNRNYAGQTEFLFGAPQPAKYPSQNREHHDATRKIVASAPVFGFRPMRSLFLRMTKEPKDESLAVSPFSRESVISFKTSSTSANDSDRDILTSL